MKKIGSGVEAKVFRLNNRRVLKVPLTHKERLKVLKRWYPQMSRVRLNKMAKSSDSEMDYYQRNLVRHVVKKAPWLLGNPVFLRGHRYTQDKVTVLGEYLLDHSLAQNKRAVQAYVRCITQQWGYGFYQKVANFTINYGIEKSGRIILIDLGELTFSKEDVARIIREKRWLKSWSYKIMKDERLKAYYAKIMQKNLTLRVLNRLWKTNR